MSSNSGRTLLIVLILLSAVLLAAGNILCHALVVQQFTGAPPAEPGFAAGVVHSLGESLGRRPQFVWFFSGAPLLVGIILALVAALSRGDRSTVDRGAAAPSGEPATDGALRLLALLQQEGRLIDFLEEDIDPYDDAQVGAAVRAIHGGCRKALHDRMRIERILPDQDGAQVEIADGFDPASVRLTGNVHGEPPFHGVVQHGGWRAAQVALPRGAGVDAAILAPAEVEVG